MTDDSTEPFERRDRARSRASTPRADGPSGRRGRVDERSARRARREVVEEVIVTEEVTLPADGALLDVVELDDEDDEDDEPEPSPYDRPGRWFVVHTYAGYENKVKQNLASRVRSMNVEERIFEVVIPMEDVIEFKNGRKVVVQKKVWPGYLLIRMGLDDESWYVVRNTPGVTGFVGSGAKPTPLSRREVEETLGIGGPVEGRAGEEGAPAAGVRGGRAGAGRRRPVRGLQRRDQRDRRRPLEAQGPRQHLRPRDPRRARVRPGRQALGRTTERADRGEWPVAPTRRREPKASTRSERGPPRNDLRAQRRSRQRTEQTEMAKKKLAAIVKIQIPAGQATPAPPVGTALGPHGINIMDFCKAYNEKTERQRGQIIPAEISIFEDRSFTFITKTPPTPFLLRQAAGSRRARR